MSLRRTRRAFTLVELLVVIAVIGVLIALLLPAVQAAREAARRGNCSAYLMQLGLACQLHADAHRHFPTGGWGFKSAGDPDRGFGADQPGGWLYNVLPYIEEAAVRELGKGEPEADRFAAAATAARTPISIANCPSRRAATLYPYTGKFQPFNSAPVTEALKTCYAANAGDIVAGGSPDSYADAETFDWTDALSATGLIYARSMVRQAEVVDGLGKTYAIGEKRTTVDGYDWGDDQHAYVGHGTDVARFTAIDLPPAPDAIDGPSAPADLTRRFGGVHPGVCLFVMADGAVRAIDYDLDPNIHRAAGTRADLDE